MKDDRLNVTTAKKSIGLQTTLCENGVINVWSERGSGKVHSVHLDETGSIEKCTCKGYKHTGGCYHVDAISQNGSLRSAARACTTRKVMTDGGEEGEEETSEGPVIQTATGWGTDSYRPPEDEEVDRTPL